jgi:hypothetical protein
VPTDGGGTRRPQVQRPPQRPAPRPANRSARRPVRLLGTAYGSRFELVVPSLLLPGVTARLAGVTWDGDAVPETSWQVRHRAGAGWQATRDGVPLSGPEGPDGAVERLVGGIERWIAAAAPDAVFVDAGVVGWRGRALVLPGRRLHGRTTLVAALVRAGAAYLSDVFAVLDHDGRVRAYPRPMPVGRPAWGTRQRRLAPGPPAGARPLPIGMVARLAHHPQVVRTERLTRGQATLALIDAAVTNPHRDREIREVAARAVRDAVAVAGTRGEAAATARELLETMDAAAGRRSANRPGDHGTDQGRDRGTGGARRQEARAATHSSSRIEWTTESRQAPRT